MTNLTPGAWNKTTVEDTDEPRLDVFVARNFEVSRTLAQRLILAKNVKANGIPARVSLKLLTGDTVEVFLPVPKPTSLSAENIPLHIYYQDSDLAVIEKPAGLVVHPSVGHSDGTLVNALLHHLGDLSSGGGIGGELRPGIVHRIDRNTSGVLLVTKTDRAHQGLSAQFKEHSITRRYRGLCWGKLPSLGEWSGPIGRDPKERKRMAIVENGRHAVTRYRLLQSYGSLSAFEAELLTGRTHQVRVHFAAHGFPLVGDATYIGAYRAARMKREAGLKSLRRIGPKLVPILENLEEQGRQFLHAAMLGFTHPASGKRLEFASELPPELAEIMLSLTACIS